MDSDFVHEKQNLITDIIAIIEKKPGKVWGLSYDREGEAKWQFEIRSHRGLVFEIVTYSWVTGDPYSEETVTSRFLAEECDIFFSHQSFLRAADRSESRRAAS